MAGYASRSTGRTLTVILPFAGSAEVIAYTNLKYYAEVYAVQEYLICGAKSSQFHLTVARLLLFFTAYKICHTLT